MVLLTEELEDQETLEAIHLLKETMVEMVTLELKVEVAEVLEVLVQMLTKMVETVEVEQLQILVDHLWGMLAVELAVDMEVNLVMAHLEDQVVVLQIHRVQMD